MDFNHNLLKEITVIYAEDSKIARLQTVEFLEKHFKNADFLSLIEENFNSAIHTLSQELWRVEGNDPHYKPPIERTYARGSI